MGVHEVIEADVSESAGFPDASKLAESLFPIAASRGLTDEVLVCARQRAQHHARLVELLERNARRISAAQRDGRAMHTKPELEQLVSGFVRTRARRDARIRFKRPASAVYDASTALIALVQELLAEEYEVDWPWNEPLSPDLAQELRLLQWHAFDALWTPRRGHADAKRLQLEITSKPLAVCERCDRIFDDNPTDRGRSKIARLCRDRCAHARRPRREIPH